MQEHTGDDGQGKRGLEPSIDRAAETAAFQAGLWQLFSQRAALYTSGESSSLPQETAQGLMASLLFTLGIKPDIDDAARLRELNRKGLPAAFAEGLHALEEKTKLNRSLWKRVCLGTPLLESRALKDSLESIRDFEERYDYRFFAHVVPAEIDYPLCHPVPEDWEGIDYLNEYLKRLLVENAFMNRFGLTQCKALLKRIHPDYRILVINLFEPIATNALGLALAQAERSAILALNITQEHRMLIGERFKLLSQAQAYRLLTEASEGICTTLGLTDAGTLSYLKALAISLWPRIKTACVSCQAGLEGVFLSF
jgi:hypothetical protein